MPFFKVVADRRSEVAKSILLHMEGEFTSLSVLNAKCPIKPFRGVAKFIFKCDHIAVDGFHTYISANKIAVYFYHNS